MIASNDPAPSGVGSGLYADPGATASWFGWAQDGSLLSAGQGGLVTNGQASSNQYPAEDSKQGVMDKNLQSILTRQTLCRDGLQFPRASGLTPIGGDAYMPSSTYNRPRSGSLDFGSDSSSASHSIPSSATSSSIHLPLDGPSCQQQMVYDVSIKPYQ